MLRPAPWVALLLVATAGCAPSGEDPRSRLTVYAAPSEEFRVRYLEPPWELVEGRGTTAILRIPSNAMTVGGAEGGPPKFELVVTVEAGEPETQAAADLRAARRSGAEILSDGVRVVSTVDGVVGAETSTRDFDVRGERHARIAYFPLDRGRVVRMAFEATPPLDTAEVDAMIGQLGVGTEP
ncbi:MAG TPA: hypothetical protein RMH99_26050 [Sandaracinaceae bacterium LLY-WYZ-13_1]|nr:hypothetical protein [Sandaracinaceae bacterium LLY-WYZ-13_1]